MANLRLLVSEVVTNAIEHAPGGSDVGLNVALQNGTVRIEVLDCGQGFEYQPRTVDDARSSGWGLHFVDRLANRWGADRGDEARVWFELPACVRASIA